MSIEILQDSKGNDVAFITNDDGTTQSMLKTTYDTLAANSAPQA